MYLPPAASAPEVRLELAFASADALSGPARKTLS